MSCYKEMYMVRHDFLIDQCNVLLFCDQFVQPMKIFGYRSYEDFPSVLC